MAVRIVCFGISVKVPAIRRRRIPNGWAPS